MLTKSNDFIRKVCCMIIKRITLEKALKKLKKLPPKKFSVWRIWGNQIDWQQDTKKEEQLVVVATYVFLAPIKFVAVDVSNGPKMWLKSCTTYTELEELKDKYPKLFEVEGVLETF